MSDLTRIKELNSNLKRIIYNEIEAYANQSGQNIRYFSLPDELKVRIRADGMVTLDFSVSALIEDSD